MEDHPTLYDRKFVESTKAPKSLSIYSSLPQKEREKQFIKVIGEIRPTKFHRFKKSGLSKTVPLRMSYWYLANLYNEQINYCYLSSIYKDKFISDILEGPDLKPYGLQEIHNEFFSPNLD